MANHDTELLIRIRTEINEALRDLNRVGGGVNGIGNAAKEVTTLMGGMFAGISVIEFGKDLIETNAKMETLRAQLKAITGDAENSFKFISDFAVNTPFEIEGLTKTFITLKNFGIEPTTEVMSAMTNQAAVLGGSQETLSGITLALGQAYAKGKLQAEEMNQLIERGVPIYKLLAEVTGKNTDELQDMAVKGELTRDVIDRVIKKMGEMSSGGNAAAMDTLAGKISNLSDAWQTWEDTLLGDKSEGLIKAAVSSITAELNLLTRNMSSTLDAQIAHAEARIKTFNDLGTVGKTAADYSGFDIGVEQNRLDSLKRQKERTDVADKEAASKKSAEIEAEKALGRKADLDKKAADVLEKLTDANKKLTLSHHDYTEQQLKSQGLTGEGLKKALALSDANEKLSQSHKDSAKALKSANSESERAAKAYASEREAVAKNIEQLNFEIAALKLSDEESAIRTEIRQKAAKATAAERVEIEALVRARYKDASAKKSQDALKERREKLGKDVAAAATEHSQTLDKLSSDLAEVDDALKKGDISPEEAKAKFDVLGKGFNAGFIEPAEKATGMLSEFSVQAARNMQSAFADFLFDPFENGMEGMAANFAKIVQRMVAEAASAQIFETLLGKNYGQSNATGGLLSALFSGVAGAVGGAFGGGEAVSVAAGNSAAFSNTMTDFQWMPKEFHTGGIIGQGGRSVNADPAIFSSATRYHSGGIPGLKPNEVPIIALNNEEVLTADDPRHRNNLSKTTAIGSKSDGVDITTHVTVSADNQNDAAKGNKLGDLINATVRQVIVTEKRPGGLLAKEG